LSALEKKPDFGEALLDLHALNAMNENEAHACWK
jgi:hypothetical protein